MLQAPRRRRRNSVAIHTLSMFAGAGMLDAGIELAFGPIFHPLAYVECEAHAVAVDRKSVV